MGCTNCDNNDLLNNENKKVVTGNIEYDGITFTCTTDPSLDTVSTDSLNTVLLRLLNAACEDNGCCIYTVSYATLVSKITSSSLIPNAVYRFPYNTKHLISSTAGQYNDTTLHYDSGSGVRTTFTPETEYLLARAVSTSKIAVEVYSESYPRDIIHYDYSLDKTEDNAQDRPGFITFRHDVDNDVSAHFDWRNVLHRRYDMDITKDRDSEYKTALNYNALSGRNHNILYRDSIKTIPAFSNYNTSGNSNIGFLTTPNENTHRDFKTFVSFETELWAVGSDPATATQEIPRFKNIHIEKSEAISRIEGSASSAPISISTGGVVGSPYHSLANVVFFTRSAENVFIGQNASGITFTGRTVREINIGHNNENIIIGGGRGKPDYTIPTKPINSGYNDDLEIGNNNRNIVIADNNRTLKIGHSNIGITFNRYCFNVEIGNHNTSIYWDLIFSSSIKDWNQNVKTSVAGGAHIGSLNKDIDFVSLFGGILSGGLIKDIPDGFTGVKEDTSFVQPNVSLGNLCRNIFIAYCGNVEIGDFCTDNYIVQSNIIKLGKSSNKISLHNVQYFKAGYKCSDLEIAVASYVNFGDNVIEGKVINAVSVITGDNVNLFFVGYSSNSVTIGSNCYKIFASYNIGTSVGDGSNNVTLRNCQTGTLGSDSQDVYIESSSNFSIGGGCTDITLNTVNVNIDLNKPSTSGLPTGHLNYWASIIVYQCSSQVLSSGIEPRSSAITGRIECTGNLENFLLSDKIKNSVASFIGYANEDAPRSVEIGSGCTDIIIISSSHIRIENDCSLINIGGDTVVDYGLYIVDGIINGALCTPAYNLANLTALVTANTGGYCRYNIIEKGSQGINFYGTFKTDNFISAKCPGLTVAVARTFKKNKIIVQMNAAITTTSDWENKVFDKSDGTNVWEQSVDSSVTPVVVVTPTKLQ